MRVSKAPIVRHFRGVSQRVYTQAEILGLLDQNRAAWRLKSVDAPTFLALLPQHSPFKRVELKDAAGRTKTLYVWDHAPVMEVLLAVQPAAFFSHGTALELH